MGSETVEIVEDDPKTKKRRVGRLSDMETHEISMVDVAANKRRFLVIKNDDVEKQVETKTEQGKQFPAGAYAFVPDSTKPSTWKLKLFDEPADVPDNPSIRLTAAAAAALGPGFRGQRVQLPQEAREAVKAKVRAAWLKSREQAGQEVGSEDLPAGLKKEKDVGAETAVQETTKRIVAARIEEAIDRVQAIKQVVEEAKSADTTDNALPRSIGRELRGTQFLLKGIAGVTEGVSFMIPGSESMSGVTEIEPVVRKAALATLEEVERRLETLKGDLDEAEMLSPAQARKIDGAADMLGKVVADYSAQKGLAVTKGSLSDDQRTDLLQAIEKTMGDLGDLYLGLQTDSVAKQSADEFEVGALLHQAASELETGVAKMLEGKEGGIFEINALVENAREIAKALGDKTDDALEPIHGFFVDLRKAAQMFEVRGGWGTEKAKVVLATGDEVVAEFDERVAAEVEALRRNVEMVTKTAKAGHLDDKRFSTRVGGPKGYQVVDGEGNVVGDFATAEEASTEANRRNLKKNDDPEEGDVEATDTSKVGRPMQGKRLNRLKAAAATLNDALGDLLAGSASMEKFKKAAQDLADVIREVQMHKSALASRGMTDTRGLTPDAPNQGSGIQPDPDAIGGIDDIVGEGTPDLTDVLKQIDSLRAQINEGETDVAKRDSKIEDLQTQLIQIKKRKAAPSTRPADADDEETEIRKRGSGFDDDHVSWSSDMNAEEWDDDGEDFD